MKFVKKITALFLAVTMVMAMGITAFAAETAATYTITGPKDGHTYEVYQIFTGDLKDTTLSNVKWGENGTGTKGEAVAADTLETIAALANNEQATASKVAKYVDFNSTAVATLTDSNSTASVVPGYYLIKDTGATTGATDTYSTYVVSVVKDLTVSPKKDTPKFEKKIQDINDSESTSYGQLQDSADYDIGDEVPFTLTATLPSNYSNYTTYYLQFQDQMEGGLTFTQSSVKVYIDGKLVNSNDYTIADASATTDGSVDDSKNSAASPSAFTITFSNLKNVTAADSKKAGDGSTIKVEYTATLNANAVIGSIGNVNEAKLKYSNNPNWNGEGESPKGETPWDKVIAFTYKTIVNKVDQNRQPLTGAAFELFKYNVKTSQWESKGVVGATKSAQAGANGKYTYTPDVTPVSTFAFTGLDDGKYKLVEVVTPAGYNTASDVFFNITATHDDTWEDEARTAILTALDGTNPTSGAVEITGNETEGSLTTSVVNQKGSNLPSTGGMGTTILYVAGIALIVVAGVVVIARKRNA